MKTTRLLTTLLATVCIASSVFAGDSVKEASVLSALRTKYPNTQFQSLTESNLPGIYEVRMGKNIAYVEETGRYFLFGHIFDMTTQTDLTEARVSRNDIQAPKVEFGALPFQDAVVTVRGDGSRKVAVFSDPDCPYCRQLDVSLAGVNNVTIFTFLFPLDQLHPNARNKAVAVWCAGDRAQAWEGLMKAGEIPDVAPCDNPIDRNVDLAETLGINGTPALIFSDGSLIPGAISTSRVEQLLNQANQVAKK